MNDKPGDTSASEANKSKEPQKRRQRTTSKQPKINPGTIRKLVFEAYLNNPNGMLDLSPELYHLISESLEMGKQAPSYFENYVTERERSDFLSQLNTISAKEHIEKEEAIRLLELLAAIGNRDDKQYEFATLKAFKNLGIDLTEGKDTKRTLRDGVIAYRRELLRGIFLDLDWSGALLGISVIWKDYEMRMAGKSLIGCLSFIKSPAEEIYTSKIPPALKTVVLDRSALIAALDKNNNCFQAISMEFLRLIDDRALILCPAELIISVPSLVSLSTETADTRVLISNLQKTLRVIWSLPKSRQIVLKFALLEECKDLNISSLYSLMLARITEAPLFECDDRLRKAFEVTRALQV